MAELDKYFSSSTKIIGSTEQEKELKKFIDEIVDEVKVDQETELDEEIVDNSSEDPTTLAGFVKSCFKKSEAARYDIENNWLDSLRQYKGLYDFDTLSRMNDLRSKAFIRLTRTKVRTVDSRLSDLLFPANGDKNWAIKPTPVPEFSEKKTEAILQMYLEETGEEITGDQLAVLMHEEATKQANKMSKIIEDELAELKYREIMRDVIHSGNVYGTGILKGPLVSISENRQYYKKVKSGDKEQWILQDYDTLTPFVENVRVWDIYPDMESTSLNECRYIVQRRKMGKHSLIGLSKRSDFNGNAIANYLFNHPDGDYIKKTFEIELFNMGDVIDSGIAEDEKSKKYEVLEFWGYVDAEELENAGVTIPDKFRGQVEVAANIWVLGDEVIKASLMPIEGVKWPYFFYYYDKDETSIFGEGIPSIMRDVQELVNSAFRALLDNAAISAGPQVEVNLDLLSEDEDPRDVYPFKVWMRTGTGAESASPAVRVLTLPAYTTEFERMIELFRNYGDEVTSIPRYMWGEGSANGAGRTASGLSMLLGSANITIKDQVKNFDDGITKPFITAMYYWNMQFNNDEDAKGDYAVVACGTSSLIAKEVRSQSLIQFAQMTMNGIDSTIVKRPSIIRAIAESLDLQDDNLVKSDKEIAVERQQEQQAAEEERQWMNEMVETAREDGVSPSALIDSLRNLRKDMQQLAQTQPETVPAEEV